MRTQKEWERKRMTRLKRQLQRTVEDAASHFERNPHIDLESTIHTDVQRTMKRFARKQARGPFYREYPSYAAYKKAHGDNAVAESEWTGQDGHWLTSDRSEGTARWDGANEFNLRTGNQGQYEAFQQILDLYKWIDNTSESQGHEVRWADGAISLVGNLAKGQIMTGVAEEGSFVGLLMELNTGISDLAVVEFGKLLYGGGGILRGNKAYQWDKVLVTKEQRYQAAPIYEKYRDSLGLRIMEDISYSNIGMFGGIPNFGMFRASSRGNPVKSLADDWQIRVDIPLLMLYPNHKPISIKGSRYINPETGTLNARYKRYMINFKIGDQTK